MQIKPEIEKACTESLKIYFGGEAEYDPWHHDVSVTEAAAEQMDFLLVPNSHTHITMPKDLYEPYEKHADLLSLENEDIAEIAR